MLKVGDRVRVKELVYRVFPDSHPYRRLMTDYQGTVTEVLQGKYQVAVHFPELDARIPDDWPSFLAGAFVKGVYLFRNNEVEKV